MSQYDDLFEIEDKPKRKRDEDPTTWSDAWKAIGIFLSIVFVVSLVLSSIQQFFLGDVMDTYLDITLSANDAQDFAGFFNYYMDAAQTPLFLVLAMILSLIIILIGMFIIYGLTHLFASKVQGGEGSLRGLIVRANWWTTGTYIAYVVLNTIASTVMISNIVNRFEGVDISASSAAFQEYSQFVLSQSG